jgi:putative SOS response-associated peptidase YedK
MCGRFAWDDKVDEQIQQYVAAGNDYRNWTPAEWGRWKPNYQVSPTDQIPIVVETLEDKEKPDGPTRLRLEGARWWLTPPWSKTLEVKVPTFNARSEEVSEKPSFKSLIGSRRAVIPMLGFYEWTKYPKPGEKKKVYFLHDPSGGYLFAAGLYSWWANPDELKAKRGTDEKVDWHLTATMLTRDMVGPFRDIHPRSPVFLPKERIDEWLSPKLHGDQAFVNAIAAAAVPEIEALEFHEVAPLPRGADGPELIAPV